MAELQNKTVVIVGGAGLLGSAISRACKRAGARVVIADSNAKKGAALASELSANFEEVDILKPGSVADLSKRIGNVDGVVNAAYPKTARFGRAFADAAVEDMLVDLSQQVGGCLSIVKAFAPLMQAQKRGSIVFLGSIYGIAAPRFDIYEGTNMTIPAEYAAIKGAVIALTRYFASLFGKDNVRINAVSPGGIADNQPENFVKAYAKHLKIGSGLLSPDDIAGAAVFLLSDDSSQLTGQNLVIDAGWTL
jgi:NAD(P)-dependent dehydrogenase (short-subunit alcohol dehydrogenase family)